MDLNASESASSKDSDEPFEIEPRRKNRKVQKNVFREKLTTVCDNTGLSIRHAAIVVTATIESLGLDVESYTISQSTVYRKRRRNRRNFVEQLKNNFKADPQVTLHWDGKILPDLVGRDNVDRIAVVLTGQSVSQLLGVPKLPSGTGKAIADIIYQQIQKWDVTESVKAFAFDTTSVNTGKLYSLRSEKSRAFRKKSCSEKKSYVWEKFGIKEKFIGKCFVYHNYLL